MNRLGRRGDLGPPLVVRAVRLGSALVALGLVACACNSAPRRGPQAKPSFTPPAGWIRYQGVAAGYELYHPPEWKQTPGSDEEDRHFSPGPDPLTGPIWLTVRTATRKQLAEQGFNGCSDYNVEPGKYKRTGNLNIAGKEAARYLFATPPGFAGDPGYETVFVVEVGERCFRFSFLSPNESKWNEHSRTALEILETVTFVR